MTYNLKEIFTEQVELLLAKNAIIVWFWPFYAQYKECEVDSGQGIDRFITNDLSLSLKSEIERAPIAFSCLRCRLKSIINQIALNRNDAQNHTG